MPRMFRVYMLKNEANGKCYVGATKKFFGRRVYEHARAARRSKNAKEGTLFGDLKQFGEDAFEASVLEHLDSAGATSAREVELISSMKTMVPSGYNIKPVSVYSPYETCDPEENLTPEGWNLGDAFRKEAVRRVHLFEKGGPYKVSQLAASYETSFLIELELARELGLEEEYFGGATTVSIRVGIDLE